MAIYHLHVKAISRATGRSATAAAAYRAGEKILDQRTGEVHDYTKKKGIEETKLILPGGGTENRAEFWNRIEMHHKRGDAVLSREIEVALPSELNAKERRELAMGFARELADRYGVATDVAIHKPSRRGDDRNHHAHLMLSACRVGVDGTLGKKAVELDPIHCRRNQLETMVARERFHWAQRVNDALELRRRPERVDHRTLYDQGIDREPTRHRGPAATGFERRIQQPSRRRLELPIPEPRPSRAPAMTPEQLAVLAHMKEDGKRIRQEQAERKAAEQATVQANIERARATEQANLERAQAQALAALREQGAQALKNVREQGEKLRQEQERQKERELAAAQAQKKAKEASKEPPKTPEKVKGKDRGGPER